LFTKLLTNRMENPLGIDLGQYPRLSFVDKKGGEGARIQVALDPEFTQIVHDSGEEAITPAGYPLFLTLAPRTRYFWRVTRGEEQEQAWFETALLDEPWQADWITPDFDMDWHPVLSSSITLPSQPISARAYVCGLGLYELSINGSKAGEDWLAPGLCAYDKWLPYQTIDATSLLKKGDNHLEVALGNGWYKGRYGLVRSKEFHYGEEFALIMQLHITFKDGSECVLTTNTQEWLARRGQTVFSSIFDGETVDATLDTSATYPVRVAQVDKGLLTARQSPGIHLMETIKPIAVITTPKGDTVLDMGQNMVGVLRFRSKAEKGTVLRLQFGEVLQNGEFYRDNLRTALCAFTFTSDGVEREVTPRFTFFGFRYVKLEGFTQPVDPADFEGLVLYSNMIRTGWITTGNDKVNQLFSNTLWGQKGNFLDTPTDCPQRDERMGWTGDAQVFFGTAAYNMDVYPFFMKFLFDMRKEQEALGGDVPVVIPKHDVVQTGACAWGDAACIIPWKMYVRFGDRAQLERDYPLMKAWVDHVNSLDDGSRLWKGSFHYGDWLSLDNEDPLGNRFGGTDKTYLASCYYRHSSALVAKAAAVLGKEEDQQAYETLSEEVRAAIQREYFTSTGRLALNTQTGYVLALHFDIALPRQREGLAHQLRLKLKESNYHLRTGFIGTPYLCQVLSDTGSNDIAYRLLLQEGYPGWLYQVNMGATTIWERWNSILPDGSISDTGMNSLNHYAYGSIVEWLYNTAAGIRPMEETPGFERFLLCPKPDPSLGHLEARFDSPRGTIKSAWRYEEDGRLVFDFEVPAGTKTKLVLPDGSEQWISGGEHHYTLQPQATDELDLPISQLLKEDMKGFARRFPQLASMMLFPMMAGEKSLNDLAREGFDTRERCHD
jgi:alpha-L-rhamnosidase